MKAMGQKDYQQAYAGFLRHAKSNPFAQFNLGLMEQNGWGRPENEKKACQWFEKAARGNIPTAQHLYAICLVKGTGYTVDIPTAITWFKQAADRGHLISWCSAGELYIQGRGVTKDVEQGLALCAQAAQREVPLAMLKLADIYREGSDVPRDAAAARYWYTQAAERHVLQAQYRLGLMLSEGQGGEPDPRGALFWLETAASAGYAPAYLPTAILYASANPQPETGVLAPEHLAKIYLWLSAAKAVTRNPELLAQMASMEAMVNAVMPPTWREPLDRQVAAHLAKYPSGP